MSRTGSSFARSPARFRPQPTVLIICEDRVSSYNYLSRAAQHFRASAIVEINHCGKTDPKGITEHALKRSKDYNQVYCVIDRDTHKNFHEARALAAASKNKVTLVISNPCFEYWLILHFSFTRKGYRSVGSQSAGDKALKELLAIKQMAEYEKGQTKGLFDVLLPHLPTAEKHALASLKDAENCGEYNPSTQIHLLLDDFRKLAGPTKV